MKSLCEVQGITTKGGTIKHLNKTVFYKFVLLQQGNQSLDFLKKLDRLELELINHSDLAAVMGLPFVQALRAFSRVVDSCFGNGLLESYIEDILEFKRLYVSLGVRITPKVIFFIFFYLQTYINLTFT